MFFARQESGVHKAGCEAVFSFSMLAMILSVVFPIWPKKSASR